MKKLVFLIGILFSVPAWAALDRANICDQITGKCATVKEYANASPLTVRLTDTSGNYVSAGAGTQYAEGDTAATATGTVSMGKFGTTIKAILTDTSGNTTVAPITGSTIKIADSSGNVYGPSIPVSVSSLPVAATGNTTKIADQSGNVYPATIPVSLASVPSHAVTNAGTFAVQNTPATGSAVKIVDTTGNAYPATIPVSLASVPSHAVTNAGTFATQDTPATGATVKVADRLGNVFGPTVPVSVASGQIASGAVASGAVASGAFASGALASGSVAAGAIATGNSIAISNSPNVLQSGTWTVQPGNTANTTPWLVTETPGTTGGWSPSLQATLSTVVQKVKATAGTVGGWFIYNSNSSVAFVQFFDATGAASVNLGTTAPTFSVGIPATSGANVEFANGINMANGICVAATTTVNGSSAPSSSVNANVYFK